MFKINLDRNLQIGNVVLYDPNIVLKTPVLQVPYIERQ